LSGPRSGFARTVGGDESFRTLTVDVVEPSAFAAVHDTGVPPVSLATVVGLQLGQFHETVTGERCHSKQLVGAGEQLAAGAGGGAVAADPLKRSAPAASGTSGRAGSARSSRDPGRAVPDEGHEQCPARDGEGEQAQPAEHEGATVA
jgi:hypothetical protein